jgi:hypothetical protein
MDAFLVDQDELAGSNLTVVLGADQVEGARLGGEHGVAVDRAEVERTEAVRVAEADQLALGESDDRVGAFEPGHGVRDRLAEWCRVVRDQRGDHLGVGRGRERDAVRGQLVSELLRVREVAVVAERHGARAPVLDDWLRVRPLCRAGRRVARVADCDLALEAAQVLLVEDLGDEAHVAQDGEPARVRDGDARRLLSAVLEREQPEEGDARHVALRGADAEHSTHR